MTLAQGVDGVLFAVQGDNIISKVLPSPINIEILTGEVEVLQKLVTSVVYLPAP